MSREKTSEDKKDKISCNGKNETVH